jgi:hypothetical protein
MYYSKEKGAEVKQIIRWQTVLPFVVGLSE